MSKLSDAINDGAREGAPAIEAAREWAREVCEAAGDHRRVLALSGTQFSVPEFPDVIASLLPECAMGADGGDVFGSAMSVFFPLAQLLEFLGWEYNSPAEQFSPPAAWGFRSGAGGNSFDAGTWDSACDTINALAHKLREGGWDENDDEFLLEFGEAGLTLDAALLAGEFAHEDGAPTYGDGYTVDEDCWQEVARVLLACGWALEATVEACRAAGVDY